MDEYIINNEKPVVWNRSTTSELHNFCDACGMVLFILIFYTHDYFSFCFALIWKFGQTIGPKVLECLRTHLFSGCNHSIEEADSIMHGLESLIYANEGDKSNPRISFSAVSCKNNCGTVYCSEICFSHSMTAGHYFLCKDAEHELSRIRTFDTRGHLGMALKLYAIIARRTVTKFQSVLNCYVNSIRRITWQHLIQ